MNIEQYLSYVNDDWSKGWLQNDVTSQRGVFVPHEYMALADYNAYDAMLLAQIYYWGGIDPKTLRPRMTHQYGNHLWIVKTFAEWAEELLFKSDRAIREGLKRLAEKKLIIKERHKSPFHENKIVTYVRQNWEVFGKAMQEQLTKNGSPELTKNGSPELTKNGSPELTKNGSSLNTKTTTEKTTEITTKTTTTLPTHHPSLLSNNSQSEDSTITQITQPIADCILDLFSETHAQQLIQKYDRNALYRICCYVKHENTGKSKDKQLTPRFVLAELNGAENVPANYTPPVDYSYLYKNTELTSNTCEVEIDAELDKKTTIEFKSKTEELSPEQKIWRSVISQIKLQNESVFNKYMRESKLREIQHDVYVVEVKHSWQRDHFQDRRLRQLVQQILSAFTHPDAQIYVCIAGETVTITPTEKQEKIKTINTEVEEIAIQKPQVVMANKASQSEEILVTPEQRVAGRKRFNEIVQSLNANKKEITEQTYDFHG